MRRGARPRHQRRDGEHPDRRAEDRQRPHDGSVHDTVVRQRLGRRLVEIGELHDAYVIEGPDH